MARFEITAPDGQKYEITAPDNATEQEVLAYAQQQFAKPQAKAYDPTEGMSTTEKVLAGTGKAFVDLYRGGKQLLGIGDEKALQAEIDEAKKLDAPLMATKSGIAGNLLGNVAIAAPTAMIPGANTITGGAALGALTGAVQPVATDESRFNNVRNGAVVGAAVPALVRGGKIIKGALVDPFTEAGRTRIIGSALTKSAADPKQAVQNLRAVKGSTPGFVPTVGQASKDQGLASVERTARAIDPAGFGDVDKSQRAALVEALRSIAKTPEARVAAEEARENAVKSFYDTAKQATVTSDPALEEILKRPTVAAGLQQAEKIAADEGRKFVLSGGRPAQSAASGILDAAGNPIVSNVPATPQTYSGQGLHDLKMGIDQAITEGSQGFKNRVAGSQLSAKQAYLDWLENKIPEYGQARETFSAMSKPINQMDIGKELYQRFVPALADGADVPFKNKADALANALRNGDDVAKTVTGMKNARMGSIMEPEQIQLLEGVVRDAQLKAAAEQAGKGPGSDTIQELAMSNLINEAGLPTWINNLAPLRPFAGIMKTAGDLVYSKNDETMRRMLADLLKDPEAAAAAMQKAGVDPSRMGEILKLTGQAPLLALPATANAQKQ